MKKIIFLIITVLISSSCNRPTATRSPTENASLTLISWGANRQGQMGNGEFSQIMPNNFPYRVNISNITQLTSGLRHSVVLDNDGSVWTWGDNQYGQLGIGTYDNQATPQKITSLPKITSIATNQHHSLAIDETGSVWAWGLNLSGQLGINNNQNQPSPVKIPNLEHISQVAVGYRFSIAQDNQGKIFAWGGQCPDIIPEAHISTQMHPQNEEHEDEEEDEDYYDPVDSDIYKTNDLNNCRNQENINIFSLTPKLMENIPPAKQIQSGFGHTLVLTQSGEIWSWGCNFYGQVGREKLGNSKTLSIPASIPNLPKITQISAGFRHSLALDEQGNLWVWGHNEFGELGLEDKNNIPLPQVVSLPNSLNIHKITAGYDLSLIVTNELELFALGQNQYNQLSSQPNYFYSTPQRIEFTQNLSITDISAGGGHILAISK